MRFHSSCLFRHWSVAVGGLWLVRSHSSCLFRTGQSLLVDFGLCTSTRLVFLTLVSRCWWTLACVLPPVLSFSTLVRRCWRTLACALPLVLCFSHWAVTVGGLWLVHFHTSCLFDTGQSLLVDFDLCAPTRLVFLTLVRYCWWTLACALPLVLSF